MPDTSTAVSASPLPSALLQPLPPPWTIAVREHLRGTEPCSEGVRRLRGLLEHLHPEDPRERIRCLHGMFSAAPAAFRAVALECGWSAEMEIYGVSWDLAVIAAVFYHQAEGRS